MWKLWYLNRRFISNCRGFGLENHKLFLSHKSSQGKLKSPLRACPSLVKDGRLNPGRFQFRPITNMLVRPLIRLDDHIRVWFTRPSFRSSSFPRTPSYGQRNILVTPSIFKPHNLRVVSKNNVHFQNIQIKPYTLKIISIQTRGQLYVTSLITCASHVRWVFFFFVSGPII